MLAPLRPEIVVDLGAVAHNVRLLAEAVAPAALMAVVKADGYGHGMAEVARTARGAGADWLGVATVAEALSLRAAGDRGRILCWLDSPGDAADELVAADIDLTVYSIEEFDAVARAAARIGRVARVQLKVDTGLSRGGCPLSDWHDLVLHAAELECANTIRVTGIWSHFASSDEPEDPANDTQEASFRAAVKVAEGVGLRPEVRHLANSAAALLRPSARFDLVRCGICVYGLDPTAGLLDGLGLVPAMTVRAPLQLVKAVRAGAGVSYGHTWVAEEPTTLGLIPAGYGDGIPRSASNRAQVWVAGRRRPIRGLVCMDQFVVDLGGDRPEPGAPAVLFGPGQGGEPTAQDWADAAGTISYEIVTRVGGRLSRRYVGEEAAR